MKKITIKQGEKDLLSINLRNNRLSDENIEEIEKFSEYEIDNYTTIFENSVKLGDVQDISEIKPKLVKEVIVILK